MSEWQPMYDKFEIPYEDGTAHLNKISDESGLNTTNSFQKTLQRLVNNRDTQSLILLRKCLNEMLIRAD